MASAFGKPPTISVWPKARSIALCARKELRPGRLGDGWNTGVQLSTNSKNNRFAPLGALVLAV